MLNKKQRSQICFTLVTNFLPLSLEGALEGKKELDGSK